MEIPKKIKTYPPSPDKPEKRTKRLLFYLPNEGEPLRVVKWCRWPSYDFIFGVPCANNPFRKQEAGFFQYRDIRRKKVVEGFYVDKVELKELITGFIAIADLNERFPEEVMTMPKGKKKPKKGMGY